MELRRILINGALAVGGAVVIVAGLQAVARADGAGMEWMGVFTILVPAAAIVAFIAIILGLKRLGRARERRRWEAIQKEQERSD